MKISKKIIIITFLLLCKQYVNGQCANPSNIYSFTYDGKLYEVVKEEKTWIEAAACAVERGGILAEINDESEQNAVLSEIGNAGILYTPWSMYSGIIWLGGNNFMTEGNWIWDGNNDMIGTQFWSSNANGSSVGQPYNNWGTPPDNQLSINALAMNLLCWPPPSCAHGLWFGIDQANTLYYVIEYPNCQNTLSTLTQTACDSYISPSGKVWTSSNTYMDTISNMASCDSIITINLTINSVNSSVTQTGTLLTSDQSGGTYQWLNCQGMTPINGATNQTYTPPANGDYAVMVNNNGCIETSPCYHVCRNTLATVNETACNSYTSPSGKIWTTSNIYLDTIPNSAGCDSIMTIHLTINTSSSSIIQTGDALTAEQSGMTYQWLNCPGMTPINGATNQSYTPSFSGDYSVIVTSNGCAATSTCHFVCYNTFADITETACYSYTSPSGKNWTTSNTYLDTITNSAGCDSIVTINLTINTVSTNITQNGNLLTASQSGLAYQWVNCQGMAPIVGETNQTLNSTFNGNFAVIVTNNACSDTSICYTVAGLGNIENEFGHQLVLYPNPTQGDFSVDLGELFNTVTITITDIHGKLIQSNVFYDSHVVKLKLNEPPGMYLLTIDTGHKKTVINLIKE